MTSEPLPRFGPESAIWRISSESVIVLGGPCAAVLQVAHPVVALGVARHSGFESDPLGRLHRTLQAVYTAVYGTQEEVRAMSGRVAAMHRRVQGREPVAYSAFSQEAQMWVLATLIDGALRSHARFYRALPEEVQRGYFHDMRQFGSFFGLDPGYGPQTLEEFYRYYHDMLTGDLLGSRPECAEVAMGIARPPKARWAHPASFLVSELLPEPVRSRLGFRSTASGRLLVGFLEKTLPILIPLLPLRARHPGEYLAARRRLNPLAGTCR